MNTKKILALSALALSIGAASNAFAVNSATSAAVPVSLTLQGSCTIDASATSGAFTNAVSGVAATVTKSTTVSVNCTATMPFKLGVTGGSNYTTTRNLSDGVHTDIPYTVKQSTATFGDADIVAYDPGYLTTSTENAYTSFGTGAAQAVAVDFEAVIPNQQPSGTYTDSVAFVVAWP